MWGNGYFKYPFEILAMVQGWPLGQLRPLIMNESFVRIRNEE